MFAYYSLLKNAENNNTIKDSREEYEVYSMMSHIIGKDWLSFPFFHLDCHKEYVTSVTWYGSSIESKDTVNLLFLILLLV